MPQYAREVEDDSFARSAGAFAGIVGWLGGGESAQLTHAQLEDQLSERGREIARLLLQEHLDLRAAREQRRDDVTGPDEIARTRAERGHGRLLATTLGPVRVTRIACRAPGVPNVHPADAGLSLPPGKHSWGLCRLTVIETARGSIGQACAAVGRAGRVSAPGRPSRSSGPRPQISVPSTPGGSTARRRARRRGRCWACRVTPRAS